MSSDAIMYRWSQWLFLTLLEAGLIYRGTGNVDWCDNCQTTLASIQVEPGGTCWRCHGPVRLIELPQWYLRISAYLEENDRRLQELAASGIWDEVALASQQIVLGRVDGVELELSAPDGRHADRVHAPPRRARRGALRADLRRATPTSSAWASDADVTEQLEQLRTGGWERSAREAETIPRDRHRTHAARPRRRRAARARLARSSTRASAPPPCSASPRATAPTR